MIRLLFLLTVFLISACSPKYRTEKVYYPPPDKSCVERCIKDRLKCQSDCQDRYNRCLKQSVLRAERIYRQVEDQYEKELKRYYREYDLYLKKKGYAESQLKRLRQELDFYRRICSRYKDREACDRKKQLEKRLRYIKNKKLKPPAKPRKVSFDEILKQERKACTCDCGCKEIYDACYQSCGGKVEVRKVCIENCD
ncbi:MAG: hypothetical protein GXN94_01470 [Aquificae bacterium]|nr:hypothetical protein [Aquificota bacterium]